MGLFTPKAPVLIGVDISSTAVKLLQLSQTGGRYRVEHYAVEPLPPNAVVEKGIVEVEAVGDAIRRALARSGAKTRAAAAAVAGSAVITKIVPMQADLSEEDMEAQIQVEANQYIPYPIEEVSLDFEVLGPVKDNPDMVNVLLAASRTENVDLRIAALDLGGLAAKTMDVEAFAMENAFKLVADQLSVPKDAVVAVIDVGGAGSIDQCPGSVCFAAHGPVQPGRAGALDALRARSCRAPAGRRGLRRWRRGHDR